MLLASDYSTPDGGAEIHVRQLRAALRSAGHDAFWFASATGDQATRSADFDCPGSRNPVANRLLQTFNPLAASALRRAVRSFAPDVVHLHMFLTQLSPSVLRECRSVPTVYSAHLYRAVCPTGRKLLPNGDLCRQPSGIACLRNRCLGPPLWVLDMGQKALLERYRDSIDMVLANSAFTRDQLRLGGFEARHLPLLLELPPRRRWPEAGEPRVVYIGRLAKEKGVRVLLRAFHAVRRQHPDARLVIAGDGAERPALQRLADRLRLGAAVDFLGWIPKERVEEVCGDATVVVVPSLWPEPLGLVALEAGAAGRPVVASRIGGLAESVVDGETGFLVPPGDDAELADRIGVLLGDSCLARSIGAAAAEHLASTVDREGRLCELIAAYEEAIDRSAARLN